MKQNITVEQFDQLNEDSLNKLDKWMNSKGYGVPTSENLLSIGQMIEFLDEHEDTNYNSLCFDRGQLQWHLYILRSDPKESTVTITCPELCDALWEAVKEVLEKYK